MGLGPECAGSRETEYKVVRGEFNDMGASSHDTVLDILARILGHHVILPHLLEVKKNNVTH